MPHWMDGVDLALFDADFRPQDKIIALEDIEAINLKGGRLTMEKGKRFSARMQGGFLFCRPEGGGKWDEVAVQPADFSKVKLDPNGNGDQNGKSRSGSRRAGSK